MRKTLEFLIKSACNAVLFVVYCRSACLKDGCPLSKNKGFDCYTACEDAEGGRSKSPISASGVKMRKRLETAQGNFCGVCPVLNRARSMVHHIRSLPRKGVAGYIQ